MKHQGLFKPAHVQRSSTRANKAGDDRDAGVYVYSPEIELAINVAIATARPLLVRGLSGVGKSSLARNVAHVLGWRYYEKVITARTHARDLLWEVDLVRRLNDAQNPGTDVSEDLAPYVVPGILWWAFDPVSAVTRGRRGPEAAETPNRARDPNRGGQSPRAVVLLDEIDKADPDFPNSLLVPLGSLYFEVEDLSHSVKASPDNAPLVIITTNEERELPKAFLRRCIGVEIPSPTSARLIEIGRAHFPDQTESDVTAALGALTGPRRADEPIADVSPAEFVDLLRAVSELAITISETDAQWKAVAELAVWKQKRPSTDAPP